MGTSQGNSQSVLNCMYANVDGVFNKQSEFEYLLNKYKPSLVFLTESKLNPDISTSEIFDIENYEVYRRDRYIQNAPGGGVVILVRRSLLSSANKVSFLTEHSYEEAIWSEVKIGGKSVLVGAIYRPPNTSRDKNLLLSDLVRLSELYDKNSQVVLCGDFNFGEIMWENNSVAGDGQHVVDAKHFLDAVNDAFLCQHIREPTHNVGCANESRLDLVFTRNIFDIENIQFLSPIGNSHHSTIMFDFLIDGCEDAIDRNVRYKYCFYRGNYAEIKRELAQIDWNQVFNGKTVLEKYDILVSICSELIEKYVPKTEITVGKTKAKWMTKEVRNQILVKERAWKRLKARKTHLRSEQYRVERNKANAMVKLAKIVFEKKLAGDIKLNPKHFWSFIRSRTKLKENVLRVKKRNGRMTESDIETANELNHAFQSVFISESESNVPVFNETYDGPILEDVEITIDYVSELLQKTNANKSMGPDGVPPKFLKECYRELASPITIIIRESLESGILPNLWKVAKICSIFKKGDKTDPLNYRPISLTCIICKLCETIIRNKVIEHLEANDIISVKQHGFRSKRSTLTNLLEYMEAMTRAVDLQIPIDVNYLDCRKAFDTVPHKRLLSKLYGYGIRGAVWEWIRDFLTERKQFVEVRGQQSEQLSVTSGVPQGSVLGPVLFLVYINDLVDELECPALIFADDAKIFVKINSDDDIQAMKRDLLRLQRWSDKWLLEFNPDKCVTLHIGHRNPGVDYELNGRQIKSTEGEKDLGVYITNDLKPAHHIGNIVAKANRVVGLVRRNFSYMDIDMCRTLYCSLVRPHLEYAVQAWSPYFKKDIEELEKVQRRMTRLVPELRNLPYEDRCKNMGITTLQQRRLRGDLIETYKIIHGYENINVNDFFELSVSATRTNTYKLRKREHIRTVTRANAFSIRVVNPWNDLPVDVVSAPTISAFKSRLDAYWSQRD